MRVKFFFAWFDFWVGFYYDKLGKCLYFCPLPCCVFKLSWGWRRATDTCWDKVFKNWQVDDRRVVTHNPRQMGKAYELGQKKLKEQFAKEYPVEFEEPK